MMQTADLQVVFGEFESNHQKLADLCERKLALPPPRSLITYKHDDAWRMLSIAGHLPLFAKMADAATWNSIEVTSPAKSNKWR